ncbi:MAG TPA: HyaD/HybD family hydrogenase maturation endopeptidase [Anaerolineae bacterium]|nr:HyaD/HybD family hydrogenase maturation endopeptidase [Anaerolineae bacterium]
MTAKTKTLILGVGNLLLSDEGVGVRVIEQLQKGYALPDEVHILDGGTMGLDLLYHLEGVRRLLIIDAVETGKEPGTLIRMTGDEVPAFLSLKISPHQIGIPDMLFAAKLKDLYPDEVVLLGVQPGLIETGLNLSPPVAARVEPLIAQAVKELERWGLQVKKKQ